MEPLDADTIRETRAVLDANLPHRCNIQTDVGTRVAGAHRASWQSAAADVACMLSPIAASEGTRQDQTAIQATWQIRLPAETIVSEQNRLIVSGEDPISGTAFARTLIPTGVQRSRFGEVARIVTARDATPAEL